MPEVMSGEDFSQASATGARRQSPSGEQRQTLLIGPPQTPPKPPEVELVRLGRIAMNDLIRGAIAGAVATLPMTATIESVNRSLPPRQQRHLPPRQITEELARRTGTERDAGEKGLDLATMASHFAFGAAMGAGYGLIAERLRLSPAIGGIGFGLAVWASNYAGVLPALGLQRWPGERPAYRNATMIAGHIVWGAVLGKVEERLRTRDTDDRQEHRKQVSMEAKTRLDPQYW